MEQLHEGPATFHPLTVVSSMTAFQKPGVWEKKEEEKENEDG